MTDHHDTLHRLQLHVPETSLVCRGTNRVLHHTIGITDFQQEARCFQQVTCAQVGSSSSSSSSSSSTPVFTLLPIWGDTPDSSGGVDSEASSKLAC